MNTFIKLILFIFVAITPIKSEIKLTKIDFKVKENGLVMKLDFSEDMLLNKASGWYAPTGWFYITLLNCTMDSSKITMSEIPKLIQDIQFDPVGESVQISLKLKEKPMDFEFFQKGILHHLFLSTRSKTHQLVINKPNQKIDIHIDPNEVNPTTHIFTQSDTKFKTAGYILGVSFLVAGVVQEDANTSANLELLTGIGILAGTFIWDKYYSTYSKNLVMTIEQND